MNKSILKVVGVTAVAVVFCVGCVEDDGFGDPHDDGRGDDSYIYSGRTVKIGNQTWMAENLGKATTNSKCYENSADSCAKYGRLYTWTDAKKACPSGWHLPTIAEWTQLTGFVGEQAGKKLKSTSGWGDWVHGMYGLEEVSVSGNGTDDYGFSALPGGYGIGNNGFARGDVGCRGDECYDFEEGRWWSATKSENSPSQMQVKDANLSGVSLSMDSRSESVGRRNHNNFTAYRYSVRCVQN